MRRLNPEPEPQSDPNPKMDPNPHPLKPHLKRSKIFPVSIISITFTLIFYALIINFINNRNNNVKYAIIIDGGSTGTRIHVFKYRVLNGLPEYDFGSRGHFTKRVNPGLSSFKDDPDSAGGSLVELLEFGRRIVPKEYWGRSEIRLMATAGLRLLDEEVRVRVIESCRVVLRSCGFMFLDDWARVISGSDEGLYAWVVANYALGTLGGDPHQTTGIIELGGASAQITFVSRKSVPQELSQTLKYGNMTYNLYSNSLLHYGQNVAFDSLKELLVSGGIKLATGSPMSTTLDPCTPKGYVQNDNSFSHLPDSSASLHATGNFSQCRAAALSLLLKGKEKCPYTHCNLGSTFMPKLRGRFLATENFFHTSKFFGLSPEAHLSDLMAAGQQFCEEDWSNIRRKHPLHQDEDLLNYCFSSVYIVAFLHDILGINLNTGRVRYTNRVKNTPLDWALGAFILQSSSDLSMEGGNRVQVASTINHNFPNVFLLVGAALSIIMAWYVLPWKKSCSKAIYDLKNEPYIISRLCR